MALVGIYVVLAFKSNIDVISGGAPMCVAGMRDFDSIAAAQAIGRLDLVSFLLTTGGILLGIFSLIGFWIIRREAMEEARDAATEQVRRIALLYGLDENGEGTYIGDGARKQGRANRTRAVKSAKPKRPNISDVSVEGAVREKTGDTDDDAERGA